MDPIFTQEKRDYILKKRGFDPEKYTLDETTGSVNQRSDVSPSSSPSDAFNPLAEQQKQLIPITSAEPIVDPNGLPTPEGKLMTMGRRALRSAPGTAGGLAGAGGALTLGSPLIAASGPAAPLTAIALALAGGFGGGALADKVAEPLYSDEFNKQLASNAKENKWSSVAGALVPQAAAMRFDPKAVKGAITALRGITTAERVAAADAGNLVNVGLGAGLPVAMAAKRKLVDGEEVDPGTVAAEALAGGLLNNPRKFLKYIGLHENTYGDPLQDRSIDPTAMRLPKKAKVVEEVKKEEPVVRIPAEAVADLKAPLTKENTIELKTLEDEQAAAKTAPAPVKEVPITEIPVAEDKAVYPISSGPEGLIDAQGRKVDKDHNLIKEQNVKGDTTPETVPPWIEAYFGNLGQRVRSIKYKGTDTAFEVEDAQGNKRTVLGRALLNERLVEASRVQKDTPPHELSHSHFDDLKNSPHKSDRTIAKQMLDAAENDPKFSEWQAQRAKDGLPKGDAEEFLIDQSGKRSIHQIENKDYSYWKDFWSSAKVRLGKGSVDDASRLMANKLRFDAPTAEWRGDLKVRPFTGSEEASKERGQDEAGLLAKLKKIRETDWPFLTPEQSGISQVIKKASVQEVRDLLRSQGLEHELDAELAHRPTDETDKQVNINEKIDKPFGEYLKHQGLSYADFNDRIKFENKLAKEHLNMDAYGPKELNDDQKESQFMDWYKNKKPTFKFQDAPPKRTPVGDLRPILKIGDKVYEGNTHAEAMQNSPLEERASVIEGFMDDATHMFRDQNNQDFSRAEMKGIHSQDLPAYNKARRELAAMKAGVDAQPGPTATPGVRPGIAERRANLENSKMEKGIQSSERYQDALPAKQPDFETNIEKETRNEKPFGLTLGADKALPVNSLKAKILFGANIPKVEYEMLNEGGKFDKWLSEQGGRVSMEKLAGFVKENGPKVEVHEYGQGGKVSRAEEQYAVMTHSWLEALPAKAQDEYTSSLVFDNDAEQLNYLKEKGWDEYSLKSAENYIALERRIMNEGRDTSGPRATSAYNHVSPHDTTKYPVQRVDVVVPSKEYNKRKGLEGMSDEEMADAIDAGEIRQPKDILWPQDNLHENLPNTLGWAAIQYHDGPNGEKIAHIFEAQSRWGQEVRKVKDRDARDQANGFPPMNLGGKDHPLLADYNRLILKAAIAEARKKGATHIAVSDAETAMMTEMLDNQAHENKYTYTDKNGKETTLTTDTFKHAQDWVKERGGDVNSIMIEREKGFRTNYDKVLPQIAKDLTGSEGVRISLGEHKNAMENIAGTDRGQGYETRARDNLIFKNADGTPKTDVTAIKFPLANVPKEPPRIAGRRYMDAPEGTKGESNPVFDEVPDLTPQPDMRKRGFLRGMSSAYDRVRELDVPLSEGMYNYEAERDRLLGQYHNEPLHALSKFSVDDINTAYNRRVELSRDGKSNIELTPTQQQVDDIMESISAIKDEVNSSGMIKGGGRREDYAPQMMSRDSINTLTTSPNSPEGMRIRNEWHDHLVEAIVEQRRARAEAKKENFDEASTRAGIEKEVTSKINTYIKTLNNINGLSSTEFGALRKHEGYGLPDSIRSTDGLDSWARYAKRAANDLAFYNSIESKPELALKLGLGPTAKPGGEFDLSNDPRVQNAMASLYRRNNTISNSDPVMKASRLLNSVIMGAKTGVINLASIPIQSSIYFKRLGDLAAIPKALLNLSDARMDSLKTNARQPNVMGNMLLDPDTTSSWVDSVSRIARLPREAIEQGSRIFTYSIGKELARINKPLAEMGDKAAMDFMEKFGLGGDDLDTLAKNFTKRVEGSYNGEGLPAWIDRSKLSPFLQLSKWSVEKSNVIYQDVMTPMWEKGDYKPALTYLFAGLLGGEGINELNDYLNQRKRGVATPAELRAKWKQDGTIRKDLLVNGFITAAQAGGMAGTVMDIAKMTSDMYSYGQTSRGFNFPLQEFAMNTIAENLVDAKAAIDNGDNPAEVLANLAKKMAMDTVQDARLIANFADDERIKNSERQNKFRDKRVFEKLDGKQIPKFDSGVNNPLINTDEKKFKRTGDLEEAADLMDKILAKYENDPEKMMKKLKALKSNSYQTMPNPQDPLESEAFQKYYEFLGLVLGEKEADARLEDYIQQNMVNKAKAKMVP